MTTTYCCAYCYVSGVSGIQHLGILNDTGRGKSIIDLAVVLGTTKLCQALYLLC